jgi:hypothetical protein
MHIYFSDYFNVEPDILDEYGAFNISLINDLPLFIDPFLLFTSKKKKYVQLHDSIIGYLKHLRDLSSSGQVSRGQLKAWYMFPEVKQLWLGYSLKGNQGSGLGIDFAEALHKNLNAIFTDFGKEKITKGSHLEKVCLIQAGVGRDSISDFTANLIKEFLCDYTQAFAKEHIDQSQRKVLMIEKVSFDYNFGVWKPKLYDLPYIDGDYVLLVPKDILSKEENWINRGDLIHDCEKIARSCPDDQLRAQFSSYLERTLKQDMNNKERDKALAKLIERHPEIIEYYIRNKENNGEKAIQRSCELVSESEAFYIKQVAHFANQLLSETNFYATGYDTLAEAKARVLFLKQQIENNDGYRLFYHQGKPIQRESDLQILYRLTWFATSSDFNSEVNNGRGPVDFKISRGSGDKSLVEFKLAKNTKLKQNLDKQIQIYKEANQTEKSLKVIFYFSYDELDRVQNILKDLNCEDDESIILVDARADNKPSASNAK